MLCISGILLVSLGLSSAFKTTENVVFEKTQELSVVRSKWVFSFFTDLQSYQGYMTGLEVNLKRADNLTNQVVEQYRNQKNPFYLRLYIGQKNEIAALKSMYRIAKRELRDVITIQKSKRVKRALVPFLGKVLSWLTGTLTKADLRQVSQHINVLSNNQERLIHVLNDTLSILNVTNIEVQKNRHALRALSDLIKETDSRLAVFSRELQEYLKHQSDFLITYLQLDLMITELRESVEKSMFYMDNVKMQMDQLSLGHLAPTVLHPNELKEILTEIEDKIPDNLALPAPIEDVWYYYKTLTCVTVIKSSKFITMVNLPLLERSSQYQVYEVHNIPLPYPNSQLSAQYELETSTIAVNKEQTGYLLMTPSDLAKCSRPGSTYCTIHNPVFKLGESRLCVISLFRQDKQAIRAYCQTRVKLDTILPQAVYIRDGNWIVVSAKPLSFTVVCLKDKAYQIKTTVPIHSFQIEPACEAFAHELTLPPYYHKESRYGPTQQRDALLALHNTAALMLWEPIDNVLTGINLTELPDLPDLDEVQDVPIETLVDRLNMLQKPESLGPRISVLQYLQYTAEALIVACLVLLILWVIYKKKLKKRDLCTEAMRNHEIATGTDQRSTQVAGPSRGTESVKSTCSAEDQPRTRREAPVDARSSLGMVLELAPTSAQ